MNVRRLKEIREQMKKEDIRPSWHPEPRDVVGMPELKSVAVGMAQTLSKEDREKVFNKMPAERAKRLREMMREAEMGWEFDRLPRDLVARMLRQIGPEMNADELRYAFTKEMLKLGDDYHDRAKRNAAIKKMIEELKAEEASGR